MESDNKYKNIKTKIIFVFLYTFLIAIFFTGCDGNINNIEKYEEQTSISTTIITTTTSTTTTTVTTISEEVKEGFLYTGTAFFSDYCSNFTVSFILSEDKTEISDLLFIIKDLTYEFTSGNQLTKVSTGELKTGLLNTYEVIDGKLSIESSFFSLILEFNDEIAEGTVSYTHSDTQNNLDIVFGSSPIVLYRDMN